MWDLSLSLLLVLLVSVVVFQLTIKLTRKVSVRTRSILASLTFLTGAVYFLCLHHQAALAWLIPHEALIVLGNWTPLLAGMMAGFVWTSAASRGSKRVLSGLLTVASVLSLCWPLMGDTPQCQNRWEDGICMQTTPYSCSAACAATLLKAHGIETTEAEMADLCLTREGTYWMGLYRGLMLKTADTPWTVEVVQATPAELRQQHGPAILSAELPEELASDPNYREECGWVPGKGHSVVFLRFARNGVVMGDPTIGQEVWKPRDLEVLWSGMAIRLVPRSDSIPQWQLARRL